MIDFSTLKSLKIPEGVVTKIVSAGVVLWQAIKYKNWVPLSTESDGKTIFNGGIGYRTGVRLSSSGSEKSQTGAVATGFIPCKPGDVVRMKGATWGTTELSGYSYIIFYDEISGVRYSVNRFKNDNADTGISNLGGITAHIDKANSTITTDENGVTTFNIVFTEAATFSQIRISATGDGSDLIVTVNEEIV